jgi:ABC-type uncharacterized transport system auxiliary subunit
MRVRYYSLDHRTEPNAPAATTPLELRIGRVDASGQLGETIAFRESQYELAYYDDQRWTEKPQEYLRRALSRELFQQRGLTRSFLGRAPVLDVELIAFEAVRGKEPKVRVQINASLHDDRSSQLEQTFEVERPIRELANQAHETDQAAAAFSEALSIAVDEISERVIANLRRSEASAAQSNSDAEAPRAQQ